MFTFGFINIDNLCFMKTSLYFIVTVLLVVACTPKASEITRITGSVEGGTDNQVTVYVLDYNIKNEQIEVTDGKFSYELATNPAVVATFTCNMDGKRVSQVLIPDGSELQLVFSSDGASLTSSNKKSINYRYQEVDKVYKEMGDFTSKYVALQRGGAPKEQIDSMAELRRPIFEKLKTLYREDVEKQKDNYLSVRGLMGLQGELTDEQMDSLIHTLDSTVIQTTRIQKVLKDIHGRLRSKEGMPFVDFSIDAEGGTVKLSDFVGNGKYVLADFWASWCQPCIVEMPHFKELYKKYNGSEFTILGIAVFDSVADSKKTIRELELPWVQILGTGDIAMNAYGINSIPHIILFGPDGTILKRDIRGEQIGEVVKEALRIQ